MNYARMNYSQFLNVKSGEFCTELRGALTAVNF